MRKKHTLPEPAAPFAAEPDRKAPDERVRRSRAAVLGVTTQLLFERGFAGATVDEISRRSGVAKTTIYRHWPTRTDLLRDACAALGTPLETPDAGGFEADVAALMTNLAYVLRSAKWTSVLPSIIDAAERDPAIADMYMFGGMLAPAFAGRASDITEENLQSRARGITLMALSNKFGWMVLSTGNKSEMSVGYATLYGDMCGGYAVLKDIYKTTVFALSRWRNANKPAGALGPDGAIMPERIITKPPTAELKPDQKDQDTLPPYDVLDDILECLIEREMVPEAIVARGHASETVMRVWRMLDRAEYKRRQAPPGVKTTRRAFGRDRRYPITNSFQGG